MKRNVAPIELSLTDEDRTVLFQSFQSAVKDGWTIGQASLPSHSMPALKTLSDSRSLQQAPVILIHTNIDTADQRHGAHGLNSLQPTFLEYAFLSLVNAFGAPVSFPDVQGGNLITDVRPRKGSIGIAAGSNVESDLRWHTENAFLTEPGNWVCLACLSNEERIATDYSSLKPSDLPEDWLRYLSDNRFRILPNRRNPIDETALRTWPILTMTPEIRWRVNYNRVMSATLLQAIENDSILEELEKLFDRNKNSIVLQPGQFLMLDNRVVVHGRKRFSPRYDDHNRWIKRVIAN